jgi:RecA-family ATPase
LLATERQGRLETTGLWLRVRERIERDRPAFVVFDTLGNLYGANENDRAIVQQFINVLRSLAVDYGTTVLILAHPSKTGMNSGDGTSGSTAWNNAVRSRLYLTRPDDTSNDVPERVLRVMKSNYAAPGGETLLRWQNGVFMRPGVAEDGAHVPGETQQARAERVFLKLLRLHDEQGQWVKQGNTSPHYAPKVFAGHVAREGVKQLDFKHAMERLLADGRIVNIIIQDKKNRRPETWITFPQKDVPGHIRA